MHYRLCDCALDKCVVDTFFIQNYYCHDNEDMIAITACFSKHIPVRMYRNLYGAFSFSVAWQGIGVGELP